MSLNLLKEIYVHLNPKSQLFLKDKNKGRSQIILFIIFFFSTKFPLLYIQ